MASPAPTHSRTPERARPLGVPLSPTGGKSWLGPLSKRLEKLQVSTDGVVEEWVRAPFPKTSP